MKRYLWFIVLAFPLAIISAGVIDRFWGNLFLSLLIPLAFLISVYFDLDQALIFAIFGGFFYDLTNLDRSLYLTVFLVLEVLFVHFSRKSVLDFSNRITLFSGAAALTLVWVLLEIFRARSSTLAFQPILWAVFSNILFSSLIVLASLLVFSRSHYKGNESHG